MATAPPASDGRRGRSRLQGYRALGVGVAVTVCVMLVVAAVGGGSGDRGSPLASATATEVTGLASTPGTTAPSAPATTGPLSAVTTAPASTTPTVADPGLLPQTDAKPDPAGAVFTAHVDTLWAAIVADDPARAMPFFFPLTAYKQVKSISDPERDWNTRLVAAFTEDIHAWHGQLGADAAAAQLTAVSVPSDQAQWIQPGVESNKGSYWRVYSTALRYQVDGRTGTFTVASMISWRGEWYVVHLASIR
jgi:hypothetical protein